MSAEGKETEVSWLPLQLGLPDRVSERVIENAHCDGCGSSVSEMINVWVRPTSGVEFRAQVDRAIGRYGEAHHGVPGVPDEASHISVASHQTGRALIRAVAKIKPTKVEGRWFRCLAKRKGKRAPNQGALSRTAGGSGMADLQGPLQPMPVRRTGIWRTQIGRLSRRSSTGVAAWTQQFKIERCDNILDVSSRFRATTRGVGGPAD